jgi:hypothetical protein
MTGFAVQGFMAVPPFCHATASGAPSGAALTLMC